MAAGLQNALIELEKGPVMIYINSERLYNYAGGIMDDSVSTGDTNHAVLLVGATEVNGEVVFTIKNSWGADWGENG